MITINRLSLVAFTFILSGILLLINCDGGSSGNLIGNPEVVRTTFEGQESEIAYLTIPFLREDLTGLIVNAGVDFNGDGIIASYETDGRNQEEWIIQNSLLPLVDTEYTVYFEIVDPEVMAGDFVNVLITAGETDVEIPWDGTVPEEANSRISLVIINTEDVENLVDPLVGFVGGSGFISQARAESRDQLDQPMDIDGTGPDRVGEIFLRKGLPDSNQRINECVGNSIANSLSWLARKCGFENRFVFTAPEEPEPIQLDLSNNAEVESLAVLLINEYKSIQGATSNRSDGQFGGVNNEFILEGKNRFSNKLGLPITSQIFSRAQGEFRFNDIKQFMRDGCDVELILVMLDVDTDSPSGLGHAVTLSGFVDKGAGDKSFIVHDPGTKNTFNDIHKLNESPAGGLTFPYIFEGRRRRALVDLILVECCTGPMPTSTPGISPPPTPEPTPIPTPDPTPEPTPEPPPTPTPTPDPVPTPGPTPAPDENCCEFNPPQGCASGPSLPVEECQGLPGFSGFFPGQTCDQETGNCVE